MKTIFLSTILITIILSSSCKKQNEWLDVKSKNTDVVPSTAKDYQALMDNTTVFNFGQATLGLISSDVLNITYSLWQSAGTTEEQNAYIFADRIFDNPANSSSAWSNPYRNIEYCNVVLDGLEKIQNTTDENVWRNIKGQALFYRGLNLLKLSQDFTKPYNETTANTDLGLPIRLSSDINVKSVRSTLKQTYEQIIDDLKTSETLLPVNSNYQTRPSKTAAQALLARLCLIMGNYEEALDNSSKALITNSTLIDFNTLNVSAELPFSAYPNNKEIILFIQSGAYATTLYYYVNIEKDLYELYTVNDLRKVLFYRMGADNLVYFKGQYTGNSYFFGGIATNELYLIKAECHARLGNAPLAMETLNALLVKRWKVNAFVPYTATNKDDALSLILTERRKELPLTANIRWEDLRRLNKDERFAKTITHKLNGVDYKLLPNSTKYVFDIPEYETNLSGITQNLR